MISTTVVIVYLVVLQDSVLSVSLRDSPMITVLIFGLGSVKVLVVLIMLFVLLENYDVVMVRVPMVSIVMTMNRNGLVGKPRMDNNCLLYTSDAADERSSVDLGGRRIIKKKKIREYRASQRDKITTIHTKNMTIYDTYTDKYNNSAKNTSRRTTATQQR